MSVAGNIEQALDNPLVVIDGLFWITHWPPHHPLSMPDHMLYRSNVVWHPYTLNETGIVVAVPRNSVVTLREGNAYQISGNFTMNPVIRIPVLNANIDSIVEVPNANGYPKYAVGYTNVFGFGVVHENQDLFHFDQHRAEFSYRVLRFVGNDNALRIEYRVPEKIYTEHINKCVATRKIVKIKGTFAAFDRFLAAWIVEARMAQFCEHGDDEMFKGTAMSQLRTS